MDRLPKLPEALQRKIEDPKSHKRLVLITVCIALLLDNMLYTVIVPLIPVWVAEMEEDRMFSEFRNVEKVVNETVTWTALSSTTPMTTPFMDSGTTASARTSSKPFYHIVTKIITEQEWIVNNGTESKAIGWLFASKAIFQLFIGPFAGSVIDRFGYDKPMFFGLSVIFLSTVLFSLANQYWSLFLARSLQGFGSSFADTSGLAMIADRFSESNERSRALGIALAFISFGCLVAPPFGGILYQVSSVQALPFLSLSLLALIDGALLMIVMKPVREERAQKSENMQLPEATPIWHLFADPYILVCAGALAMSNVSLAFLEPTIAMWMEQSMSATNWQMGLVWLPAFPPYVLSVYLTVWLAARFPKHQWLVAALGLAMEGASCLLIPFTTSFWMLMVPLSTLCVGIAMVDTALLPTLGYIVDTRYTSVYGSVYAIADISYCLAYALGPVMAGSIVAAKGFDFLNYAIFISNVAYAPVLFFLWRIFKYRPLDPETEDLMKTEGQPAASATGPSGPVVDSTGSSTYNSVNGAAAPYTPYTPAVEPEAGGYQDRWGGVQGMDDPTAASNAQQPHAAGSQATYEGY